MYKVSYSHMSTGNPSIVRDQRHKGCWGSLAASLALGVSEEHCVKGIRWRRAEVTHARSSSGPLCTHTHLCVPSAMHLVHEYKQNVTLLHF